MTESRFTFGPLEADDGREAFPPGQEQIVLHRRPIDGKGPWSGVKGEEFALASRITYAVERPPRVLTDDGPVHGALTITVPAGTEPMETDLTSVPGLFTWLVPKSGAHLPAALVHDGLYSDAGAPDYRAVVQRPDGSTVDARVDRIDADAIFREAMAHTGVGVVRRWLVWAAVTLASLVVGARPRERWDPLRRLYFTVVVVGTLLLVAYLGVAATLDLADREVAPRWWLGDVPWIPEGRWWEELASGGAGAVVVPVPLAALWLRYWPAGLIACLALATLLHVSVALLVVVAAYQAVDLWVSVGPPKRFPVRGTVRLRAALLAGVVLAFALAIFATALG